MVLFDISSEGSCKGAACVSGTHHRGTSLYHPTYEWIESFFPFSPNWVRFCAPMAGESLPPLRHIFSVGGRVSPSTRAYFLIGPVARLDWRSRRLPSPTQINLFVCLSLSGITFNYSAENLLNSYDQSYESKISLSHRTRMVNLHKTHQSRTKLNNRESNGIV